MKVKFDIKTQVQLQPEVIEEKINAYLKKNFYRVVERGPGFVIFIDDEYSDRKKYQSDYHARIGEGKFIFHAADQGTFVKLIYLTPILYPVFLMMLFAAFAMYTKLLAPFVFSFAFTLPVVYRIFYLKEHVFNEILDF